MQSISVFKNFTTVVDDQTLKQVIDAIRSGQYKQQVMDIRTAVEQRNAKRKDMLKKQLPAFTTSGKFMGGRTMDKLMAYCPFVILDIDKLSLEEVDHVRRTVKTVAYTLAGFVSPSGYGYKIIVKTNATLETHKMAFQAVADHYEKKLGVPVDRSGKDVTRLCFFSYDAEAFWNEEARVFELQQGGVVEQKDRPPNPFEKETDFPSITNEIFGKYVGVLEERSVYENGNRNNHVFLAAGICNSAGISKAKTKQLLKAHFEGLSEEEIDRTVNSSFKSYDPAKAVKIPFENPTYVEITTKLPPTIPQKVYEQLPPLLRECCRFFQDDYERDLFLTGAIGMLSGCMPKVYGKYHNRRVYPNLYTFVLSPVGNGKGNLSFTRDLGEHYHQKILDEYQRHIETYEQDRKSYEERLAEYKRGIIPDQPTKPVLKSRKALFIPANTSSSMLIRQLKDNGGGGIFFELESDTLSNALKQDWGGYSDILRKAAHHEPISYSRKHNNEFVEIVKPRLSAVLSGTPNQVIKLIPSVEDGLFSRFLFYFFDVNEVWCDVFLDEPNGDRDECFKKYAKEVTTMIHFLEQHPTEVHLRTDHKKQLNETFAALLNTTKKRFGKGALSVVKRLGLMSYRMTMLFTALRKYSNRDTSKVVTCHADDFSTAMWLIDVYLKHSLYIFDNLPQQEASSFSKLKEKRQRFYNQLPAEFHRGDLKLLQTKFRISYRTVSRYLECMIDVGCLERNTSGLYRKI